MVVIVVSSGQRQGVSRTHQRLEWRPTCVDRTT
jgi:hypothetical protein